MHSLHYLTDVKLLHDPGNLGQAGKEVAGVIEV